MSEPHTAATAPHPTAADPSADPAATPPRTARRPPDGRPPGPDPVRLAAILARAWLEVRTGRRPLHQLAPLLSPAARRRLAGQLPPRGAHPGHEPARVGRTFPSTPAEGVREVAVMVEQGGRTTAIAVRMERHRGAWRAVELTAPEAGLAALPTASLPEGHRHRDAFDEVLEEHGETDASPGSTPP
jgi:hypothetical protein